MNDKILYIIAGANGSGKTTFALNYKELNNLHFINADEIAKQYDSKVANSDCEANFPRNDMDKYKIKAGKEFFKQLENSLAHDKSFMIETTLSGKYLKKVIEKAKKNNFKIVLMYLFLETDNENILRVKNRVLNGGHDIPVEDIKRRYIRSRELFMNLYKDMVDKWILFFNGNDNYELIANNEYIFNDEKYKTFVGDLK